MGCSGSSARYDVRRASGAKTHDVFVTCTNTVQTSEDFACFFAVWVMKHCAEQRLSVAQGRTQLGASTPKPGSREVKALRSGLLASRVLVCIVNIAPGPWPPPGYAWEVALAREHGIAVVPFYDADRYVWKEVCNWQVELPDLFRSGLGPIRYHRNAHEDAKAKLTEALNEAIAEDERAPAPAKRWSDSDSDSVSHRVTGELSRKERLLMAERKAALETGQVRVRANVGHDDGLDESALGLQRSDFERAGLVQQRLERTNSLRDINVETALALLAKQGRCESGGFDPLAAREGGCRLVFADARAEKDALLATSEPMHRVLKPATGILKKKDSKGRGQPKRLVALTAPVAETRLRLMPGGSEERRRTFAVQQLQQHLDSLQADDVHELMTVQRCLRDGVEENSLVVRALRLLTAFLENHLSLHPRAMEQGAISSILEAMRRHHDIDVLVFGVTSLNHLLEGIRAVAAMEVDDQIEGPAPGSGDFLGEIAKHSGPEVITGGMRHFTACEALQERGCRCFGLLCQVSKDNQVSQGYKKGQVQESTVMLRSQARTLLSRHGAVDLVLTAMLRFTGNAVLQANGCMALRHIGAADVKVKRLASKEGSVLTVILAALTRHPSEVGVQRLGCAALRHFTSNSQENKTTIARHGGVPLLCAAARRFAGADARVTAEALGALCHLASKHPENKRLIFHAGALDLAAVALQAEPSVEVAMAACGLLHNLACDEEIKRHVVKLGGRAMADQLVAHEAPAVRNLAKVLQRTLAPRDADASDPFGSLFAMRTPGASRKVASKRGRRKAQAALRGAREEDHGEEEQTEGDEDEEAEAAAAREPRRSAAHRAREEDREGGDSDSGASAVSAASAYSAGGARRPGQRRRSGVRRFAKAWSGEVGAEADVAGGGGPEESTATASNDEMSEAESHLSLEANEMLADDDLAEAIANIGGVQIRRDAAPPKAKRPRRPAAPEEQRRGRGAGGAAPAPSAGAARRGEAGGFGGKLRKSTSALEEQLTRKLDQLGQSAKRSMA